MISSTVTVYACSTLSTAAPVSTGAALPTGTGVASTGVVTAPTTTGSPIAYATGAASMNGVSAFGIIVAGGVALVCSPQFLPVMFADMRTAHLSVQHWTLDLQRGV